MLRKSNRLLCVRQSDMVHGEGSGDNDSAAAHPTVSLLASSIITRYILQPGFVAHAARLSSFRGTASSASLDCRRRCPPPTAPSVGICYWQHNSPNISNFTIPPGCHPPHPGHVHPMVTCNTHFVIC
jgi:hypothetical protein